MLTLNWLDVVLLVAIAWSALTGLRAGLARVVVGLVATVVGFMAGFWCYRLVGAKLAPWIKTEALANVAGFFIIFAGTILIGTLIASLLSKLFRWVGLSWFNHLLGGLAGFLRGTLVIAATLNFIVAFAPSPLPGAFEHSRVLPYVTQVSLWMTGLAPRDLKDAFTAQLKNLRQLWGKQPSRGRET